MHPDVEQEEYHTQFRQQVRAAALMDQVEHSRSDQDSGQKVADNRAEIERPGDQGCCRAEPQKGDCRHERAHGVGRAHFSGHGGALSFGWL